MEMAARQLGQWKSLAAPTEEDTIYSHHRCPPAPWAVGGNNFPVDRNLDKWHHYFINLGNWGSSDQLFKIIDGLICRQSSSRISIKPRRHSLRLLSSRARKVAPHPAGCSLMAPNFSRGCCGSGWMAFFLRIVGADFTLQLQISVA